MIRAARALLGFLTFTACLVAHAEPEPHLVAIWRDGSLARDDYESWLAFHRLESGPEAIREMVFVETLAAISRERGVERETRFRLEVESMRQKVLLPALRKHVVASVEISDEEIEATRRAYPNAYRRPRKLLLRNIYQRLGEGSAAAATRARMEEIHRQVLAGADFESLARRESQSQSRFRDGYLGYLALEELPPPVAVAVRELTAGRISRVVEHGDGLTIFLCEGVREAYVPTPAEVSTRLRNHLARQRERDRWDSLQESLLAELSKDSIVSDSSQAAPDPEDEGLRDPSLDEIASLHLPGRELSDLSPPERENLGREWALGVLGARRAVEIGLDREPEVEAALRWRRLALLARRELVRRIDELRREPVREELLSWFAADPTRYREPPSQELAVIHFGAEEPHDPRGWIGQASDVDRRLDAGELTFAAAARRYSQHPSAPQDGLIGWRTRRQIAGLGPVALAALRRMKPGERSGLLRLQSGLWILELRGRREGGSMTFEEAEEQIRDDFRKRQIRQLEGAVREEHLRAIGLAIREPPSHPQRELLESTP